MIAAFCVVLFVSADSSLELLGSNRARLWDQAIKKHYGEHGKWPRQLIEVAVQLEEGKQALLSPWGSPYQYILAENEKQQVVPFVWTVREVNGKERVYGKKPPEPKKK